MYGEGLGKKLLFLFNQVHLSQWLGVITRVLIICGGEAKLDPRGAGWIFKEFEGAYGEGVFNKFNKAGRKCGITWKLRCKLTSNQNICVINSMGTPF